MEQDKENIKVMEGAPATPTRPPLQEVGNTCAKMALPMVLKRAQYSQITPFSTPKAKTPLRQKVQVPCAMRTLTDSQDVPLNSLIFKKVIGILSENQKDHEDVLKEKDEEISRLQKQLSLLAFPTEASISTMSSRTYDTVDSGHSPKENDPLPETVQASGDQSPSEVELSDAVKVKNDSFGFLPQLDSVCSLELAQAWGVPSQLDFDSNHSTTSPSSKHTSSPIETTIYSNEKEQVSSGHIAEKDHSEQKNTSETPVKQVGIADVSRSTDKSMLTPPQSKTPVMTRSFGTWQTPLSFSHVDTMVTPVSKGCMAVGTSPVLTHSQETNTTFQATDAETNTDTVKTTDVDSNTSLIHTSEVETNTDLVQGIDVNTNTDMVQYKDTETEMTPVKCQDSAQSTSPVRTRHQLTCTTPPRALVHRGVATSPVRRPSEIDFNSLGVGDLALQLETAAISNTLLRSQVETLQQEKNSVVRKAALTSAEVRGRDEELRRMEAEMARREQLAKMSASTQVDELMEQQAMFLSQISGLQTELVKRDTGMNNVKAAHDQSIASLQAELANLRKDLVAAYQLRKQEVAELKAEYAAIDYKPHYERARRDVQVLQAQLSAFTGLSDELQFAQKLQDEAAELVSRRAQEVEEKMELLKIHFKQHQEWEQRQKEFEEQLAAHQTSCSETENLKEQLVEAEQKIAQLTKKATEAFEQEKVQFVELESLRAALKLKNKEIDSTTEGLKTKTDEMATLKKDYGLLREALNSLTEGMAKLTQERNRYMTLSEQQRVNLKTLRTRAQEADQLEKELQALRADYKFLTTEHKVHRAEDASSLERIQELMEENERIKEQLLLAGDELEAARAHHQLFLQHKEGEHTAALTALDDALQKVHLLHTRVDFCKLQCSPDTEPEAVPGLKGARRSVNVQTAEASTRGGRKSFVSSILRAVSGVNSPTLPLPSLADAGESPAEQGESDDPESMPLHVQITGLVHTLEALLGTVEGLADFTKDTAALRSEVLRLQQSVESHEATIERYKNQKIKLNYNWKMAEQELRNLEQMVETVREVLCIHEADIRRTWREANRLHRLGMFSWDETPNTTQYNPETITKTC